MSLAHASLLLLAPLGLLAVLFASRRTTQELGRDRRIASLALRSLIVFLLTLALGGPVYTRIADFPRNTVFLLDVSASVPSEAPAKALAALKPRWDREIASGHRCALVAFAGRAQAVVPSSARPLDLAGWTPPDALERSSTDVGRAVDCARSLFRAQSGNRIVLLTDGIDSTRAARDVDLPSGTIGVSLADAGSLDVAIADVQAPLAVRSGEPFDVRVTVVTNRACDVDLSAVMDETGIPEASRRFSAPGPGRHIVVLPHLQQKAALAARLHTLMVMAKAPGDRETRNNVGLAAVTVTGKPKVLVVQGAAVEGEFIALVLQTQDIDFTRQSPGEFAAKPDALDGYVAVVLAGVTRDQLPPPAVAALRAYVEHAGGGLWVVGSSTLAGGAGYAGGELEKLLPVTFTEAAAPVANNNPPPKDPPPTPPPPPPTPDPADAKPAKVLAPSVALLLVVDKSGSMAGRNIEIVKEACIKAAENLSPKDVIGVLAFDYSPKPVLEFTEADRIEYIRQRILRLLADGGTRIEPALQFAFMMFMQDGRAQRCAVKHAVLLSDGDAPAADYETVVRRMAEEGITVSTVCVSGAKFDPVLMSNIASWGKGRFKFTHSFDKVPDFIVNETKTVIASLPKDDSKKPPPAAPPKTPDAPPIDLKPPPDPKPEQPPPLLPVVMKDAHDIFAGIDGRDLPGLRGRLGAVARPKADVPLTTRDGKPVLALGRLGLGKTAVWASDLSGNWSKDWIAWKESPKLFAQLLRYVSGSGPDAELAGRVRITRQGSHGLLHLDSSGAGGAIKVADAEGRALAILRDAQAEGLVVLPPDKPGELRRVLLQREDGKTLQVGALSAYDEEFAPADASRDLFANGLEAVSWEQLDTRLDDERVAGESRRDLVPWLIIAALLLLPVDVALRRVMLG